MHKIHFHILRFNWAALIMAHNLLCKLCLHSYDRTNVNCFECIRREVSGGSRGATITTKIPLITLAGMLPQPVLLLCFSTIMISVTSFWYVGLTIDFSEIAFSKKLPKGMLLPVVWKHIDEAHTISTATHLCI